MHKIQCFYPPGFLAELESDIRESTQVAFNIYQLTNHTSPIPITGHAPSFPIFRNPWSSTIMDMTTIMSWFKLLTYCIVINWYILTNAFNTWSCYCRLSILLLEASKKLQKLETSRKLQILEYSRRLCTKMCLFKNGPLQNKSSMSNRSLVLQISIGDLSRGSPS